MNWFEVVIIAVFAFGIGCLVGDFVGNDKNQEKTIGDPIPHMTYKDISNMCDRMIEERYAIDSAFRSAFKEDTVKSIESNNSKIYTVKVSKKYHPCDTVNFNEIWDTIRDIRKNMKIYGNVKHDTVPNHSLTKSVEIVDTMPDTSSLVWKVKYE